MVLSHGSYLFPSPGLKVLKFHVNLLNIDVHPQDVIIAVYGINDVVVETIKLLQKVQFSANLHEVWVFGHRETKQLLATGVCDVFAPESVKAILKESKSNNSGTVQ